MKVLLVNNLTSCGHGRVAIPSSLIQLGSMLRKQPGIGLEGLRDVEVAIATVDEKQSGMQISDELRKHSPDVVGTGVYEQNICSAGILLERVRAINPKIRTIVGGPFATIMPKTTLAKTGADVLCRGESDFTFRMAIERMVHGEDALGIEGVMTGDRNGEIYEHAKSREVPKLSLAEITAIEPDRELILETMQTGKYGYLPILTARGCPFNSCSFCKEGSNWRRLDNENTKRRIGNMVDTRTGLTIGIDDSSFGGSVGKLKELLTAMRGSFEKLGAAFAVDQLLVAGRIGTRKPDMETIKMLRDAGFERVLLGIESFSDEMLRVMKNGRYTGQEALDVILMLARNGIKVDLSLILTHYAVAGEDLADSLVKAFELAKQIKTEGLPIEFYNLMPFALPHVGTQDYFDVVKKYKNAGKGLNRQKVCYREGIGDEFPYYEVYVKPKFDRMDRMAKESRIRYERAGMSFAYPDGHLQNYACHADELLTILNWNSGRLDAPSGPQQI